MRMKIRGSGNSTEQFKPNSWRPRDYVAAAVLFLGSAAFVLWQNARVAVLWDLSYLLDTSWRIALGQMPYRDFPLVCSCSNFGHAFPAFAYNRRRLENPVG